MISVPHIYFGYGQYLPPTLDTHLIYIWMVRNPRRRRGKAKNVYIFQSKMLKNARIDVNLVVKCTAL